MSKIQKALGKIQGPDSVAGRRSSQQPDTGDSLIVAKLVDRGSGDETFTVCDKCLHVDGNALRDAGLIAPDYHEHLLANQYRDIKRPLIPTRLGSEPRESSAVI